MSDINDPLQYFHFICNHALSTKCELHICFIVQFLIPVAHEINIIFVGVLLNCSVILACSNGIIINLVYFCNALLIKH